MDSVGFQVCGYWGQRIRYGYLATILEKRQTQEWMELFERHDIPAAPMYSVPDILQDDHIVKTDFVRKVQHSSEGPLLFSDRHSD